MPLENGEKKILLVRKMHVQRAISQTSSTSNIARGDASQPSLLEDAFRRVENMLSRIHTNPFL